MFCEWAAVESKRRKLAHAFFFLLVVGMSEFSVIIPKEGLIDVG